MSSDSHPHLLALMPPLCYLSPHCLNSEELKWRQVIEKYLHTLRNKQFCAKVGFRWGLSSQGEGGSCSRRRLPPGRWRREKRRKTPRQQMKSKKKTQAMGGELLHCVIFTMLFRFLRVSSPRGRTCTFKIKLIKGGRKERHQGRKSFNLNPPNQ